jgi:hypothetical protein
LSVGLEKFVDLLEYLLHYCVLAQVIAASLDL